MSVHTGYCTNVHAGADLPQTRANLERYALAVKRRFSPDAPMGIGLWLSASAARSLRDEGGAAEWAGWLAGSGLVPFTLNGFPFGDFHSRVVKHQVYRPTWWEPERLRYTRDLIALMHTLLPEGMEGTISTLPIAWGDPPPDPADLAAAASALRQVASELARLELDTGRVISLCLEPEPGCVIQRSEDVGRFFETYLLPGADEAAVRRHLRVCHDVCHAVVMFEEQADVLARYRAAGIRVGKVQVSSAVVLPYARTAPEDRAAAVAQLAAFDEDRYLHQTVTRDAPDGAPTFYEDLSLALAEARDGRPAAEWRVHFHVPVYLERFGLLEASRQAILDCARAVHAHADTDHFEVETYAWGVLPPEMQQPDLAAGIADEMRWFAGAWEEVALSRGTARGSAPRG
jgi:hypothetical protein